MPETKIKLSTKLQDIQKTLVDFAKIANNSDTVIKSLQAYLEGTLIDFNEHKGLLKIQIDSKSCLFSIEHFECAYIPRPDTKVYLFQDITQKKVKIIAFSPSMQVLPFAQTYEFTIKRLSRHDPAQLQHEKFGTFFCHALHPMQNLINNRYLKERQKILLKVIQAGYHFYLIPLQSESQENNSNDLFAFSST